MIASLVFAWRINHIWLASSVRSVSYSVALLIPLFVAPFAAWPLLRALIKIDRLEKKMRELATFDSLTGLMNRRAFLQQAESYLNYAVRYNIPISVLLIDLDYFKSINDNYGHADGDEVLRHFGKMIRENTRKGDGTSRFGGEEFALFMPNMSEQDALKFAVNLNSTVRTEQISFEQYQISYTVSIGLVSLFVSESEDILNLFKKADIALFQAKQQGRDRTVIYAN